MIGLDGGKVRGKATYHRERERANELARLLVAIIRAGFDTVDVSFERNAPCDKNEAVSIVARKRVISSYFFFITRERDA